jgi:hypothetical protein
LGGANILDKTPIMGPSGGSNVFEIGIFALGIICFRKGGGGGILWRKYKKPIK